MKHLKESILTSIGQGDHYFEELYKKWGLDPKNIVFLKDSSIDYDGNVDLSYKDFTKLPFKFNKVTGNFECYGCKNLLSLEGSPKEVEGRFDCSFCENLYSLKGGPKRVGDDYWCRGCGGNFTEEDVNYSEAKDFRASCSKSFL